MTYCLNPDCPAPHNPDTGKFCQSCGWRLALGDRYRTEQPIGQGRTSRTFLGWETLPDGQPRRCLIKAFTPQGKNRREQEEAIAAFREKVALLDVVRRHPQIPDFLAYFERNHQQYLVQDYAEGITLEQQFQTQGTFDESQILRLLQTVLPILQFIHEHGIIHRDLKPDNLIQMPDQGFWVLGDLGSPRPIPGAALGEPGYMIGSAEYAAPEQLRGQATFASDLYSLGAICLHLITGLSPFDLFDSNATEWRWRTIAPTIRDRLAQILDKLVQPNLKQRYSSAQEVLADLQPLLQAHNIAITPVSPQEPERRKPNFSLSRTWYCAHILAPPDDLSLQVHCLAFHPQGTHFAVGCSDRTIYVWDAETMLPNHTLTAHDAAVSALAYSRDGRYLASGSWDTTIRLWDVQQPETPPRVLADHTSAVEALLFSPDGQQLISGGRDRALKFWRVTDEKLLYSNTDHAAKIESLAISERDPILASGDAAGEIKIWYIPNHELLRTLAGHQGAVSAIILADNPPQLISAGWDMTLKLRNPHTGGLIHSLKGHTLPICAIALHPDGDLLATGSHDTTVKLWSLSTGECLKTLSGHDAAIEAIAFSPNGELLATISRAGTIRIWLRD